MRGVIIAVLVAISVAACASAERRSNSDFRFSGESFEMRAGAPRGLEGDARAEAIRIDWLEHYLSLNGLCPNGYTITNRTAVLISDFLGESHNIFYEGRCR